MLTLLELFNKGKIKLTDELFFNVKLIIHKFRPVYLYHESIFKQHYECKDFYAEIFDYPLSVIERRDKIYFICLRENEHLVIEFLEEEKRIKDSMEKQDQDLLTFSKVNLGNLLGYLAPITGEDLSCYSTNIFIQWLVNDQNIFIENITLLEDYNKIKEKLLRMKECIGIYGVVKSLIYAKY